MLLRKSVFSLLIIIFVFGLGTNILFNSASALAATTDWQLITGPTVKVHAVIKPYINITINSPATIQSNLSVEGPAVVFDCNQGPGTCLLYTSDAADDLLCVDLGGRRIIKKKNNTNEI